MSRVVRFDTYDVRFPTSTRLDGSDAMNPSPDYSAAYLIIRTGEPDPGSGRGEQVDGHAYVFTIGQGNEVQIAAIRALEPFLVGRDVDEILGRPGRPVPDADLRSARCAGWGPSAASCTWRSAPW